MLSNLSLLVILAFQPPQDASGFRPATTPDVQTRPATPLSAEMRGDIFMARKMYREAAEVFKRRSTQGTLLQERSVEERAKMHYTLAKAYARAGRTDLAILYVRKALEEGFKEREKFQKEPEFASLQDNDDFKKLMAVEPKV